MYFLNLKDEKLFFPKIKNSPPVIIIARLDKSTSRSAGLNVLAAFS
jgi:hypothetical protein